MDLLWNLHKPCTMWNHKIYLQNGVIIIFPKSHNNYFSMNIKDKQAVIYNFLHQDYAVDRHTCPEVQSTFLDHPLTRFWQNRDNTIISTWPFPKALNYGSNESNCFFVTVYDVYELQIGTCQYGEWCVYTPNQCGKGKLCQKEYTCTALQVDRPDMTGS